MSCDLIAPDAAMLMLLLCLCSVPTVHDYASNIFTKLHVLDRTRVIVRAQEAGLGRRGGLPADCSVERKYRSWLGKLIKPLAQISHR
jgi:hypothetical protein